VVSKVPKCELGTWGSRRICKSIAPVSRPAVLAAPTPPDVPVGLETHGTADPEVGATYLRIGPRKPGIPRACLLLLWRTSA
jgi:hypothetical protein